MANQEKYAYLFPFEQIKAKSRVFIYGAGNTGIEYVRQIMISGYCEIIGMIDKEYERLSDFIVPVYPITVISKMDYDYIVIALRVGVDVPAIRKDLIGMGANERQIVFVGTRSEKEVFQKRNNVSDSMYAFKFKDCISIAIRLLRGMGDIIIAKSFINRLCELCDYRCKIDIFGTNIEEYIQAFYSDLDCVNTIVTPQIANYDDISSSYMLSFRWEIVLGIDSFKKDLVEAINPQFYKIICDLEKSIIEHNSIHERTKAIYIHTKRAFYEGTNIYIATYYRSILGIYSTHVDIPMDKNDPLLLRENGAHYITINYGNGTMYNGISKQWPKKHYNKLIELIIERYPDLEIVQVGAKGTDLLDGCNKYVIGENLESVKAILFGSICHIDIEGGLVHLATQLGTKCIVLFGPTEVTFYGYEQNINISAGKCHGCFGLSKLGYKCARNLDEPECMYSITPELVLRHFDEYMQTM